MTAVRSAVAGPATLIASPPSEPGGAGHGVVTIAGDAGTPRARWLWRLVPLGVLAGCAALMFGPFTRETVGGAAVVMMLTLMFLKVPVAIALTAPGVLGLLALRGERAAVTVLTSLPFEAVAQWSLSVIPMFILMGLLLWRSGITDRMYVAGRQWLGWLPGGLAIGTNAAGAGLAAVSGSTVGTTYALARIGIPEMLRAGYDRRLAVGSIIVAGMPGQLIPPSIGLVIYAGIAEVPVGPQLIAGIGPGLLVTVCYGVTILALCLAWPALCGRGSGVSQPTFSWTERRRSVASIWALPVLVATVLGGMFSGLFTATEAGAAGAAGAMALTFWYKRKEAPLRVVRTAAVETVSSVGSIFFLLIGAFVLARLLSVSGIGTGFSAWVVDLGLTRVEFLLLIAAAYLVMGMFMDPLSIMLLTVPLLVPTLAELDISLLWFGVFAVFMGELAVVTPPVGILSFIVYGITKDPAVNQGQDVSLGDVFRSVGWFMPITVVIVLLLIAFPEVATWLPDRMG